MANAFYCRAVLSDELRALTRHALPHDVVRPNTVIRLVEPSRESIAAKPIDSRHHAARRPNILALRVNIPGALQRQLMIYHSAPAMRRTKRTPVVIVGTYRTLVTRLEHASSESESVSPFRTNVSLQLWAHSVNVAMRGAEWSASRRHWFALPGDVRGRACRSRMIAGAAASLFRGERPLSRLNIGGLL